MPKLPSSADVPVVSPRVATDPGVRIPLGAEQTTLGIGMRELAPAAQALTEVAIRQQNRRDTVDRVSRINQYNLEAEELLSRMNAEDDLSDEAVLQSYGEQLTRRRQELLGEHQGSRESQAALATRLLGIESAHQGRAAALSTSIGREKVLSAFDTALSPMIDQAAQDPSRQSIDRLHLDLEAQISDLSGALSPPDEERLRDIGREQIALSATNTLLAQGRVEQADEMFEAGGLSKDMAPDTQRQVRAKIDSIRFARDEGLRRITQIESALGRPLTDDEKLSAFGIAPKAPLVQITPGETERAKTEGAAMGKIVTEDIPNLRRQLGQLEAMKGMLAQGLDTGGLERLKLTAANFFGVGSENLANLGAFQAVANAATLSKTSELKGAISERELDFVAGAIGSAGVSARANQAILEIQTKLLERERDSLQLMSDYHAANNGSLSGFDVFLQQWADANPMFTQEEMTSIQRDITDGQPAPRGAQNIPQNIPLIEDQTAYDALPEGAHYTSSDGQVRIKAPRGD